MITPESMAAISKNVQNPWIARFEKEIEEAARSGMRCTLLCYTDCGDEQRSALKDIEDRGFSITVHRETIGGALQSPGYYAGW